MSKPEAHVALVVGPDCDLEAQAVRATLEYWGVRVTTYWIGRPQDLIDVLSGEELYPDIAFIYLAFHGEEGRMIMPELEAEVYEPGEPQGSFGPEQIDRYAKLRGKLVLANGCTLGAPEMAAAFLRRGCSAYISPDDYPDGSMALMFAHRLFYELIHQKKDVSEAFVLAQSIDEEARMYRLTLPTDS